MTIKMLRVRREIYEFRFETGVDIRLCWLRCNRTEVCKIKADIDLERGGEWLTFLVSPTL